MRRVVSVAKKATGDQSEPPVQPGEDGYPDWVIVSIRGLREFKSAYFRAARRVITDANGANYALESVKTTALEGCERV
jgi:hypothetical protein